MKRLLNLPTGTIIEFWGDDINDIIHKYNLYLPSCFLKYSYNFYYVNAKCYPCIDDSFILQNIYDLEDFVGDPDKTSYITAGIDYFSFSLNEENLNRYIFLECANENEFLKIKMLSEEYLDTGLINEKTT